MDLDLDLMATDPHSRPEELRWEALADQEETEMTMVLDLEHTLTRIRTTEELPLERIREERWASGMDLGPETMMLPVSCRRTREVNRLELNQRIDLEKVCLDLELIVRGTRMAVLNSQWEEEERISLALTLLGLVTTILILVHRSQELLELKWELVAELDSRVWTDLLLETTMLIRKEREELQWELD